MIIIVQVNGIQFVQNTLCPLTLFGVQLNIFLEKQPMFRANVYFDLSDVAGTKENA